MTVRLTLPAAPREATPATSGARPALRAARRVLVVDDDAGNRESLTELLALSGYDVRAAASGEEALAELARGPFEAALVDLAMPDMDGLELAARLRERAPATRVALVTGWEPEALPSARRGLVDAVFRKPIDLGAILAFLDAPAPAGTDAAAHG
jgi:two-component system, cell cycle sensor histidine kinase and response regulator CckA